MRVFEFYRFGSFVRTFGWMALLGSMVWATDAEAANRYRPRKIGSIWELANILRHHAPDRLLYRIDFPVPVFDVATGAETTLGAVDHSDTNVQVQGVDEADIVKVGDDGYIYRIQGNRLQIIKAFPVEEAKVETTLDFVGDNFQPTGLYLDDARLVVIGSAWTPADYAGQPIAWRYGWWGGASQTLARVYDISDHSAPKLERSISIDGSPLDSRKVGRHVYFMARTYPNWYFYPLLASNPFIAPDASKLLPGFSDSALKSPKRKTVRLRDVAYFPDFAEPDYLMIASFDVEKPDQETKIHAYLGSGDTVFASAENLYLSASRYSYEETADPAVFQASESTRLYKFALEQGDTVFAAEGEVPGTVLNQFSMDEYVKTEESGKKTYFRVAVTTHDWNSADTSSRNALYVLDQDLNPVGKLENLAPGEQIYAARFMGERCYLVTYRTVDPLFVIGLSDPENPAVLGELKIPGYSQYLHPLSENRLIGVGKDAVVVDWSQAPNPDQVWQGVSAYYQGMKIALFDVSNVNQPAVLREEKIGDRGTDSPILWDHKAWFQDASRDLFGFPVQVARIADKTADTPPWEYGNLAEQAAYVYRLTRDGTGQFDGFTLEAKVTHFPSGESASWERGDLFVNRIARIGSVLYTLSDSLLQASDLNDVNDGAYRELGQLILGIPDVTPVDITDLPPIVLKPQ
jgi:hypothetical protein